MITSVCGFSVDDEIEFDYPRSTHVRFFNRSAGDDGESAFYRSAISCASH